MTTLTRAPPTVRSHTSHYSLGYRAPYGYARGTLHEWNAIGRPVCYAPSRPLRARFTLASRRFAPLRTASSCFVDDEV